MATSSKDGVDEVIIPFPRSLAGTGKPLWFSSYVLSFLWTAPVFKFLLFIFFLSCLRGLVTGQLLLVSHFILGRSCSVKESTLWKGKRDENQVIWGTCETLHLKNLQRKLELCKCNVPNYQN
jgi:hypothetical protein